jgi:hypothetical protein
MGSFSPFIPTVGLSYAGWVPTITGQLSFSLIGLGGAAPGCVTANVEFQDIRAGHPRRRVAVIKRRVTRDLPVTFFPIPDIFRSIAAEFVLLGETRSAARPIIRDGKITERDDEIGVLTGDILVVPYHPKQRGAEKSLVNKIRRHIAAIGDSAPRAVVGTDADLKMEMGEWKAEAALKDLKLVCARFELYRTGEFRLKIVDSLPVVGTNEEDQSAFDSIIASQIYYFVKDIAHRHYHHRPASDNLLPLTAITADDDLGWRRETLWSLARAVLEMRRSGRLPGHKSALGVLAYAEAFQGLLAKTHRTSKSAPTFELTDEIACYDFTHTRQSLDATIAEKSFIHSQWSGIQTFLVGTCLAFAALWLAFAQVRDLGCQSETDCPQIPAPMTVLIAWALEQPHIMAAALLILGAIYVEVFRRSLMVVTPLRAWGEFIGDWFDAIGATISRVARQSNPVWGDQIGATIAWIYSLLFVLTGLHSLGALLRIWHLNVPITVFWLLILALVIVVPILHRQLSKRG